MNAAAREDGFTRLIDDCSFHPGDQVERRTADRTGGLETQPELGLSEAPDELERRSAEAQARMARLRGDRDENTDTRHSFPSHIFKMGKQKQASCSPP